MRILVTGSAGFIAGYVVSELLARGHEVVGIDNFSKYGPVSKTYDGSPGYHFVRGDCKDTALMTELASGCDQIIAGASMIGGIAYFHAYAYDLLAENERILAATFDAAIAAFKTGRLQKINVISSSMVFESTGLYPTRKASNCGARRRSAPMVSRNWQWSISPGAPLNNTACPTRSSGRSIAWAWARGGLWAKSR